MKYSLRALLGVTVYVAVGAAVAGWAHKTKDDDLRICLYFVVAEMVVCPPVVYSIESSKPNKEDDPG